jgi:hypothetical protein
MGTTSRLISLFRSFNSLFAPKNSLLWESREFARKALSQMTGSFFICRYRMRMKLFPCKFPASRELV